MYKIENEDGNIIKTSRGFNNINFRPVKFKKISGHNKLVMPSNGLVFYASLNGNTPNIAETNQSLTTTGTVTYQTVNGIPCGYFNGNSYIISSYSSNQLSSGNSPSSISVWVKRISGESIIGYGNSRHEDHNQRKAYIYSDRSYLSDNNSSSNLSFSQSFDTTLWHHYCWIIDFDGISNHVNLYCDGVFIGKGEQMNFKTDSDGEIAIATDVWYPQNKYRILTGYIASARIYNRALTQDEITLLSKEFDDRKNPFTY